MSERGPPHSLIQAVHIYVDALPQQQVYSRSPVLSTQGYLKVIDTLVVHADNMALETIPQYDVPYTVITELDLPVDRVLSQYLVVDLSLIDSVLSQYFRQTNHTPLQNICPTMPI